MEADAGLLVLVSTDAHARTAWRFVGPSSPRASSGDGNLSSPRASSRDGNLSSPAYVAKCTEHSGVGLYAARAVRAGERVIAESPLATWCVAADATNAEKLRSFEAMAARLPPQTAEAILRLSQSQLYGTTPSLLGTWQTNGLPINYENEARPGTITSDIASRKEAAVYATICRINHSCAPNCHAEWHSRRRVETVHALRDIALGEELTICYLQPRGMQRDERRARLRSEHGFVCRCARCELSGEAFTTSEARQRAVGEFHRPAECRAGSAAIVQRLNVRLRLMREEGMPAHWAWKPLIHSLVSSATAEFNHDRSEATRRHAMAWAERARDALSCAAGKDHPASQFVANFLEQLRGL